MTPDGDGPDAGSAWVTTVIPTFERCDLLRRAIRSVLDQSYTKTRVNVFDNRSTDGTAAVVKELAEAYPGRVEFRVNETNIGSLLNFDRAIRSVETPFFTIMSDDDVLLPGFVEAALAQLDRYPGADIASGRTWGVSEDGTVLNKDPLGFPTGMFEAPKGAEVMIKYRHPDWQGMLFKRTVLDTCQGLNPEVEGFDVDFVIRAAALHGIVFFEEDVALFMRHREAATFDLKLKYIYPSYLRVLESIEADPQIPSDFKRFARREIPARLERVLRPYILREAVSDSPRELDLAVEGLLDSRNTGANRRLTRIARLLRLSPLLRRIAREILSRRRMRTRAQVATEAGVRDFSQYVRT